MKILTAGRLSMGGGSTRGHAGGPQPGNGNGRTAGTAAASGYEGGCSRNNIPLQQTGISPLISAALASADTASSSEVVRLALRIMDTACKRPSRFAGAMAIFARCRGIGQR